MSALLFIDSFDHYSAAQGSRKWTTFPGGTIVSARTSNGLQGGTTEMPTKTFNTEYSGLTMGVAYKTQSFANSIIKLINGPADVKVYLQHYGDGRLTISPEFGVVSSPSSFVMNTNQWYYFELQASLGTSIPAGLTATARVNGVTILTYSYTYGWSAVRKFAGIGLDGPGGGANATVDDVYVTDTELLGDVRIGVLYPNAAGDSSAWTPNAAGANYTKVKEHPADDDTTYVSAATTTLKDLYNLDDIDPAFTGVIKGAQALWCVKKSDEGDAAVKGVWKSGTTEIVQAAGHNYLAPNGYYPSATSYLYDIQTERKSLFTSSDWTKTEINGLQLGITRTV